MKDVWGEQSKCVLSDFGGSHFPQGPALALLESVDHLCNDIVIVTWWWPVLTG